MGAGGPAEERGGSVSALPPRARGRVGRGPGVFSEGCPGLLRKPRDFHGALEKSAMEMVMEGIEAGS